MKAVTVAGGSSDDPEIEAETTVLEGESKATAEADADAEPKAEVEVEPKGRAGAGPDSELPGEADPETDTEPEAEADPRVAAEPEAEAAAAEPEPDTGAEAGTEPERKADPRVAAKPEPAGKAEAAAAEPEPEDETAPRSDTEGDAEPETDAEPKVEADSAAQPKTDADAEAEAERAGEADSGLPGEARSEAEPVAAEPKTDAEADAEPAREAASQADPKDQADAEPDSELKDEAEAEAEREAEPEAEAETAAETETDAEPERQAEVTARAAVESEAEADGGEPVGKDRAGAGPDVEPEPEAKGASAADAASDETMLIVLPKKKPAEPDAPRKAPSWAREVEPDPERTSQFVALKDVDLPAPVAPRAQPQSPDARVAGPVPATPLPPLDLLAELTNSPAPVETPRRTALRRAKIWTPILLLLVGAGAGAQLLRPLPAPQLVAAETDRTIDGQFSVPWPAKGQGAVRISGSGDIGTFGEQKPVPTASVAKVMTAYVILKGHPLRKADPGPDITIDAKTVADGNSDHESRVEGLTVGQKFSQQDVLKMLMIPSGNNAARLLARWDTGSDSEAAFVTKMNAAAKELGMTNTTYTDPSGLDSGTVSTAVDQLKLAEAVMKDEVFRSIVALPNASIKGLSTRLENNNILLTSQGLSIRGIKTGSSTPAGGTLMWAAYKSIDGKDQLILGTLMDQHVDGPDEDGGNSLKLVLANSKTIIGGVRTALASAPVIRKGDVVGHVDDGLGGRTPLVAAKDLNVIGVPGQKLTLSLARTSDAGPLPHTAKAGSEVAVLTVGSGEGARSVPVAVKGALVEPSFGTRLTRGR
ncbi:serine hydrolase [Streptomyces nojiriensis]|uniref:D-alanyl-D-alanine carboxypeptidase family protein n=1 Tax=Streptomyces nojiriensis TaxID=66374 RepID=UPI002E16BEA0